MKILIIVPNNICFILNVNLIILKEVVIMNTIVYEQFILWWQNPNVLII